jgi:hypothetical protein
VPRQTLDTEASTGYARVFAICATMATLLLVASAAP